MAQRISIYLAKAPSRAEGLARALLLVKERIRTCSVCCNLSEEDPCRLCRAGSRDENLLCVVESPLDVLALERSGFRGRYHVLMGVLSPLDGIGPKDLRIEELMRRIKNGSSGVREVIVATNPTVEGEATASYLATLLKPFGIRVMRIAYGISLGTEIEYADEATLSHALEGRREML